MRHFETLEPSDLEYDPQLAVVAEWFELDAWDVERELRIVEGRIMLTKPEMPHGFVVGMIFSFTSAVLLLPGVPLLIVGIGSSVALLTLGAVTTALGGVGLLLGIMLAVLGNDAEEALAAERARLVQRREELQRQLDQLRPPPTQAVPPAAPPGVWREAPRPALVVARF
ncbi:MAG: hypothetical protein AB1938_32785 [Myxococcota bacterium]